MDVSGPVTPPTATRPQKEQFKPGRIMPSNLACDLAASISRNRTVTQAAEPQNGALPKVNTPPSAVTIQ
jgi:hypothetical protein